MLAAISAVPVIKVNWLVDDAYVDDAMVVDPQPLEATVVGAATTPVEKLVRVAMILLPITMAAESVNPIVKVVEVAEGTESEIEAETEEMTPTITMVVSTSVGEAEVLIFAVYCPDDGFVDTATENDTAVDADTTAVAVENVKTPVEDVKEAVPKVVDPHPDTAVMVGVAAMALLHVDGNVTVTVAPIAN